MFSFCITKKMVFEKISLYILADARFVKFARDTKWKSFFLRFRESETLYWITSATCRFRSLARRDRFIFDIREQLSGGTELFSGSRVNLLGSQVALKYSTRRFVNFYGRPQWRTCVFIILCVSNKTFFKLQIFVRINM